MKRRDRGFTLLEVMVAMAILSLGLTIILSSQAGLFAATKRVQAEAYAGSLMRCKMSEVEADLLTNGYSLLDRNDSGECCEDEDEGRFRCEWSIETIELPQPSDFEGEEEVSEVGEQESSSSSSSSFDDPASGLGDPGSPMGDAAAILGGSGLSGVAGMGDLAGTLGESTSGGGLIGMALGLVYPTLKPMLEASIRKVKVAVIWDEGRKERRFEVVQYVTNPMEGALNPNAAEGVEELMDKLNGVDSDSPIEAKEEP